MKLAEGAKDVALAAPAAIGAGASAWTASEVLAWVTICYMLVLIGYTLHRWRVRHVAHRWWLRNRWRSDAPPPSDDESDKAPLDHEDEIVRWSEPRRKK